MSLDPVTMMGAGMALNAGGSILGGMNSQDRVGAVNASRGRVAAAERDRQNAYRSEAQGHFNAHLPTRTAESEAGQRETAFKARDASITANQNGVGVAPISQAAPAMTETQRMAQNLAQTVSDNARRQAVLSAYGDVAADNSRSFNKVADNIGLISNFARGSQAILPAEFAEAEAKAYADNPPSPFADLLKAAGTGLSMYGMFSPAEAAGPFSSIDELIQKRRLA